MTTPAPMTAEEIVEALCTATLNADEGWDIAAEVARRDRIKAALVAFVDASRSEWCWADIPCEKSPGQDCDSPTCKAWRAVEEACRK